MRTVLPAAAVLGLAACQPAGTAVPAPPANTGSASASSAGQVGDPAGTYRRTDPSNASLTLSRTGDAWDVVIVAAGLPNGMATASDCEVRASGSVQGDVVTATVRSAGGMEEAEMGADPGQVRITLAADGATVDDGQSVAGVGVAGEYCPMGSDITGRYIRQG